MTEPRPERFPYLHRFVPHWAAVALAVGAAGAGLDALAGLGARWDWWHFTTGFGLLRWGAGIGLTGAVLALTGLAGAAVVRRRVPLGAAALGLVLGAAAVGLPWWQVHIARSVPPIHDISTDLENPPRFEAVVPLREAAGATNPPPYDGPAVARQQRRAYPDIEAARYREPPGEVLRAVERTARGLGWEVHAADPAAGRLEATATTFWFGFEDDVVVRVQPEDGGGATRVDVRSKSRVGVSDVGANAARIRRFLEALRSAGLTPAGQ